MSEDDKILAYRLKEAEKDISELREAIDKLAREEAQKEKQLLRWGIMALGSVVVTLGGVLWAYRGVIFK